MPRNKKTLEEQITEAEAEKAKAAARLSDLKSRQADKDRKADTRRKVVIGGAMLADAVHHPETAKLLRDVLKRSVTRDIDKQTVADFLKGE